MSRPFSDGEAPVILLLLDRVTDPHNVGAILRSAEVFGAAAVIAPHRHSAPETGALAKTASGALERQPYLRVQNLADTMERLKTMGYFIFGLDGEAEASLERDFRKSCGANCFGSWELKGLVCGIAPKIPVTLW